MAATDDDRWSTLKGGYRLPFDPRDLIKRLENESETKAVWNELWSELHHQGDVGDASYAAVPLLVAAHRNCREADWNTYAIVSVIELARTKLHNPPVPDWPSDDYFAAIQELCKVGLKKLVDTTDSQTVRAILSIIALAKGLRTHAEFLVNYDEDELRQFQL